MLFSLFRSAFRGYSFDFTDSLACLLTFQTTLPRSQILGTLERGSVTHKVHGDHSIARWSGTWQGEGLAVGTVVVLT